VSERVEAVRQQPHQLHDHAERDANVDGIRPDVVRTPVDVGLFGADAIGRFHEALSW
jgi:hypothetical protein